MSTFVLVHGAWHGAWCWNRLEPQLQALGHRSVSLDLPGHGDDPTPRRKVGLDSYATAIAGVLAGIGEQVILVGHSMGGMAISAAAELAPTSIRRLVYLAAFLPRNGESLFSIEERNPRPSVPEHLLPAANGKTATLDQAHITDLFYHDCCSQDIDYALARLTPQPLELLSTPITLTPENFGSVPRAYIQCMDDHAISIELQRDMIGASPCAEVVSMNSSHSPFFSQPEQLAGILARLA